jgi:hypothetical protein
MKAEDAGVRFPYRYLRTALGEGGRICTIVPSKAGDPPGHYRIRFPDNIEHVVPFEDVTPDWETDT